MISTGCSILSQNLGGPRSDYYVPIDLAYSRLLEVVGTFRNAQCSGCVSTRCSRELSTPVYRVEIYRHRCPDHYAPKEYKGTVY